MSQRHARIQSLDALRGFALFGILAVNIQLFAGWGYLGQDARDALSSSGLDAHLNALIDVLAQGKFYSLFSLLFGYSFVMLAGKVGAGAAGQHLRRMLGLLVVGIAHAVFAWQWTWQVHEFGLPWSDSALALLQDNVPHLAGGGRTGAAGSAWSPAWRPVPPWVSPMRRCCCSGGGVPDRSAALRVMRSRLQAAWR